MEDVIGTKWHIHGGGRGNWLGELQGVASMLREASVSAGQG